MTRSNSYQTHKAAKRSLKGGLVITQKVGQQMQMTMPNGGEIFVTPLATREGKVRLHVHAPSDVRIDREEVAQRRAAEAAAETPNATQPEQSAA